MSPCLLFKSASGPDSESCWWQNRPRLDRVGVVGRESNENLHLSRRNPRVSLAERLSVIICLERNDKSLALLVLQVTLQLLLVVSLRSCRLAKSRVDVPLAPSPLVEAASERRGHQLRVRERRAETKRRTWTEIPSQNWVSSGILSENTFGSSPFYNHRITMDQY